MGGLPLLWPAAGWVAGIALARLDTVSWNVMMAAAGVATLLLLIRLRRPPWTSDTTFCVFLLAGLGWGWIGLLSDASRVVVDDSWLDTPVLVSGRIAAVRGDTRAVRLEIDAVRRDDGAMLPGRAWLYVYAKQGEHQHTWLAGERIEATARLHAPRNHHNPSGFDFEAWCFDRHIALLGGAVGTPRVVAADVSYLEGVRQRIRETLAGLARDRSGVLRALLLGEREDIPERVFDAFAATGAAHLLAISGLHVGLVAGFGVVLVWWLLTRRERWIVGLSMHGMPVRGLAMAGGVLLALMYAQLADWPLPTQRAALMLAAGALAWWLSARGAPLNVMLAALMLILLIDPAAIGSLSLWLSFAATTGILLWVASSSDAASPTVAMLRWLGGLFAVTFVASLATLPLVADVFGRLPVYSLPANLFATPLYTLFVLPVSLSGAALAACGWESGAHAMFALAGHGVGWCNAVLERISQWPAGSLFLPDVPLWLGVAYVLTMAAAFKLWTGGKRLACCALAGLALGAYGLLAVQEGRGGNEHASLIAWDVGQGAASSLMLPGDFVMVVDAAGRPGSRFNAGTTMAEGFRGMGIVHLDVLVLSHDQSDHAGGALSLVRRMNRVGELWLADVPQVRDSARMALIIRQVQGRGGQVRWLAAGDVLERQGIRLKVLWPPRGETPGNRNDASLVLRASLPDGRSLLFPGDIESPVEQALLDTHVLQPVDGMLLPHHGSATSSTTGFVQALRPRLAIAQTGLANRYGFPAEIVRRRYLDAGAHVFDTSEGAVTVGLGGKKGLVVSPAARVESPRRNRALQWWRHFL